jgi:two-component system sensor histidine kinase KdpD
LINRLQRGDIYPQEKVSTALANFFTEGNLSALREIALREVASEVDRNVQTYREDHNVSEPWLTQERIMVCISPDQSSERILRRGSRIATRLKADIVGVYVSAGSLNEKQKRTIEEDFACAKRLNIRTESVEGTDIAQALADYAIKHQVSEIIIGHSERHWWEEFLNGSIINRLIRKVPNIDVLVVANRPDDQAKKGK